MRLHLRLLFAQLPGWRGRAASRSFLTELSAGRCAPIAGGGFAAFAHWPAGPRRRPARASCAEEAASLLSSIRSSSENAFGPEDGVFPQTVVADRLTKYCLHAAVSSFQTVGCNIRKPASPGQEVRQIRSRCIRSRRSRAAGASDAARPFVAAAQSLEAAASSLLDSLLSSSPPACESAAVASSASGCFPEC